VRGRILSLLSSRDDLVINRAGVLNMCSRKLDIQYERCDAVMTSSTDIVAHTSMIGSQWVKAFQVPAETVGWQGGII